ncbi:hypothetical protein I4F81_010267 [Pyropia yezoensis]|uniref:Uncharacterized protein n=1 Tax=Pyropia yezoensis TaxID=2788 RepID=A0ACC3CBY4_PYRYE|nr:hypothetical protein I4F81_010267 [Neopyropia yezoensis]
MAVSSGRGAPAATVDVAAAAPAAVAAAAAAAAAALAAAAAAAAAGTAGSPPAGTRQAVVDAIPGRRRVHVHQGMQEADGRWGERGGWSARPQGTRGRSCRPAAARVVLGENKKKTETRGGGAERWQGEVTGQARGSAPRPQTQAHGHDGARASASRAVLGNPTRAEWGPQQKKQTDRSGCSPRSGRPTTWQPAATPPHPAKCTKTTSWCGNALR